MGSTTRLPLREGLGLCYPITDQDSNPDNRPWDSDIKLGKEEGEVLFGRHVYFYLIFSEDKSLTS